ncbi:WD40-repeat-containing domain protein [Polychytrium aggregatum]|uniref:WD40-repeat-containing domain protein n=1 Tax=Polychytrium aggregatum TaxID=110093 RepID=UPI0022FE8BA2|nr:WD40-repeat-containing domain protein [Polychytrium aggregatum]KAI9199294.1 WD40-repeat-containing domain protein [Polychytrium aggregatum]
MSSDYKKLGIKKYPRLQTRQTAETRYWRKFKSPILVKEYAAVTGIHFSPVAPFDFAVTSSARVQIYSQTTHSVKKSISRFKDTAYSGTIRDDGKLLVAGDASGLVQVFDLNSRAILRTLEGHKDGVRVAKFSSLKTQVLSASDDKTVKLWDVPVGENIVTFDEHEDYVRCGMVSQENSNLVLTGSYDHTVKLWDARAKVCVATMNHGFPVESVLMFPGGGLVASAGGAHLKIWDILGGGRLIQSLSNHQKTITSMCFDGSYSRILTASLDQHVKIYNVQDYKITHSVKYPAPILSIGLSPDDTHLVVGMTSGLLSIRQRVVKTQELVNAQRQTEELRGGTYKYFIRGSKNLPGSDDLKIESRRKKRLRSYDKYLKTFQYGSALDAVLATNQPVLIISLLEELIHRDGLKIALGGRDEDSLEPTVRFLMKNLTNPRYSSLLIDISNLILDMYGSVIGQSIIIDELLSSMKQKMRDELNVQEKITEVLGFLDTLFSSSLKI